MTEREEMTQTSPTGEPKTPQQTYPKIDEVRGLVREGIDETDPKQRAAKLLNELFSANFTRQKGEYISPLNVKSAGLGLNRTELDKRQKKKELYASLVKVKEAVERDGGITEETYECNKYAINSLSRDLAGQRWWGSGLSHFCEQEDREGKKATVEQIARFPMDQDFTEDQHGHTNIFDQGYNASVLEGTLFNPKYEDSTFPDTGVKIKGAMESLRIFHQGHRNALSIRTVKVSELVAKVASFVSEFKEEVPGQQFGFTLDREAYLRKMSEFNEQFGALVTLEVMSGYVVAKFNSNPRQVAERLVELGRTNGMNIVSKVGAMTYVVLRIDHNYGRGYAYADLFLQDHMQGKNEKFDPEKHKDAPTVLLPYLQPEFANDLIVMYVAQE